MLLDCKELQDAKIFEEDLDKLTIFGNKLGQRNFTLTNVKLSAYIHICYSQQLKDVDTVKYQGVQISDLTATYSGTNTLIISRIRQT